MRFTAITSGVHSASALLNPSFKATAPDAVALARYLLKSLIVIKKYDLPVRIYLTKDVSRNLGNILLMMGIKFRTIPVTKMVPPYILLTAEGNYLVIKTVDENNKEVHTYKTPFVKFVEALEQYLILRRSKRKKAEDTVDEIIVSESSISSEIYEKISSEENGGDTN